MADTGDTGDAATGAGAGDATADGEAEGDRQATFEGAAFGVQLGGLGGAGAAVVMLPPGFEFPAAGTVAAFGFLVAAGLSWLADDDAGLLLAGVALAGAVLFADGTGDGLAPLAALGGLLVAAAFLADARRRGHLHLPGGND